MLNNVMLGVAPKTDIIRTHVYKKIKLHTQNMIKTILNSIVNIIKEEPYITN